MTCLPSLPARPSLQVQCSPVGQVLRIDIKVLQSGFMDWGMQLDKVGGNWEQTGWGQIVSAVGEVQLWAACCGMVQQVCVRSTYGTIRVSREHPRLRERHK